MKNRIAVIIPARFASSRLPGKPLIDLGGKPMIQHVYERASAARADYVLVATDDERIATTVRAFGGEVVMTDSCHLSGTDRVAEAARTVDVDIVVNVQGDEPLLDPSLIDLVSTPLADDATLVMSTVAHPLGHPLGTEHPPHEAGEVKNPNIVKVVCDRQGFALYFSRSPIPYDRHPNSPQNRDSHPPTTFLRHLGLYAYRCDFLQTFTQLSPTPLEQREQLEQLRAVEHGYRIRVMVAEGVFPGGVDTATDAQKVRYILATQHKTTT